MSSVEVTGRSDPPTRTPADGSRLPSLTGLRFVAAFLVFCFHISISGLSAPSTAQHAFARTAGAGAVGVSFFFVLSGFVLTWSARPDDTARAFWRRRAAKIYPNYVVAFALSVVGLYATGHTVGFLVGAANLGLVQAWWPDPGVYFGANSVSWSLACEAFFYALFPALLPVLGRVRPERLWAGAAVCVAAVCAVPVAAAPLPAGRHYWFVYIFPPVRLLEFVLGMVMALLVKSGRLPRFPVWSVAVLLVLAYAVTPYFPPDAETSAVTVIPFALLIATVAVADVEGRRSVWRSRWAVWLGEVSFAFYLVHQSVIVDLMRGLDAQGSAPAKAWTLTAASLALSVALAGLLHRFVEVPAMRRLGRRRTRTSGRLGPAGSPP
ncbi:acyltransferase family protein [Streptomyces sp. NPDC006739]|uniref:acyltransferase family protein n=1 Tax=Streptomyces sp. NPDC006739 TaxID=3364763 RepID=UPI0036818718